MVQYLHDVGTPWDHRVAYYARNSGNEEICGWLLRERAPMPKKVRGEMIREGECGMQ